MGKKVPEKKYDYHLVDTGLEPGYYDPDYRMLCACFALLCHYVEVEMGGVEKMDQFTSELRTQGEPLTDETLVADQADNQSEAAKLYHWWKVDRPAREARVEELTQDLYGRPWGKKTAESDHYWRDSDEIVIAKGQTVFGPLEPPRAGDREKHDELRQLQNREFGEDQDMLHRLIDIRGSLWI